jgi:glycosyltransferase involved in cell wall biosynthesis
MDIVFVAHFAGSPIHGMVFGHYHLAREWVRLGHRVTIVAASNAHTRVQQPEMGRGITEEYIDGIRYLWIPTPSYTAASRLGRIHNILSFTWRTWMLRLPIHRADIVICSSHHPFAIHPAQRLARRYGARLVFEVRDLWPLTLVELGGASPSNPFIRAMQFSEDYAYHNANAVVSVLAGARQYMIDHGMAPEKFAFVPNGVDTSGALRRKSLPPGQLAILEELRKQGSFVIGYAGRLGLANALHTLVDAAIQCTDAGVCVALLGDGPNVQALRERTAQRGMSGRVVFLDPVNKDQVPDFLGRVDATYLGLQRQPLFRFGVSPTKLGDYMLAAKPVIQAIDAPGDIVAESGCGVSCRAEDVESVSVAIRRLAQMDQEERASVGERGRRWLLANRDYRVLAERFLEHVTVPQASGGAS